MELYSDNIDEQLEAAYRAAIYELPQFGLSFRIGEYSQSLAEFMIDNNIRRWVFISPENPGSRQLSGKENGKRHEQMTEMLDITGWRYCEGEGKDEKGEWPSEKSYLILNMGEAAAIELAEVFEQKAIVTGDLRAIPKLVMCM